MATLGTACETPAGVTLLDIRADKHEKSLLGQVRQSLRPASGDPDSLPTLLVYDEKGLRLFERITYLDDYYLTNAEIDALTIHADAIAARISRGTRLVELGSGNLRKVKILLEAFEKAGKDVDYFALDLSLPELNRTFSELDTAAYKHVSFNALHGTYDDGLDWLCKEENKSTATCVMTLGSSIGNFPREEAASFLADFAKALAPGDSILVGLDACQQPQRVFKAYNDSENVTEEFYRNGLDHANRLLGHEAFKQEEWAIEGVYDTKLQKHQASYVALKDVKTKDFHIRKGGKLHFEDSFKYSQAQSQALWHAAGLIQQRAYANSTGDYHIHFLTPAKVQFSDSPTEYAANPVPSTDDWRQLWAAWDTVTKSMVPQDELLNKPIKLRNNLIFYLGHIPTFADIHMTKATGEKPTEPASYARIFERGIDPDVDNPDLCHDHSEIPDSWPPLDEILDYQANVRDRIANYSVTGNLQSNRRLARGLWLAFEHEAMHLETFLYMLLQSDRSLPPPGSKALNFKSLAQESAKHQVPNQWNHVPASEVVIGLDDPENDLGPDRFFGWDNERPARTVSVARFEAQSRPISNGEYARFLEETKQEQLPASWKTSKVAANGDSSTNGFHVPEDQQSATARFVEDKAVRTVYGPVPLKYALDWPIMASYDELAAYAAWSNGRIPTFEEARSLYAYVERKKASAERYPSTLISAVNGHLCNEGVQETPPSDGSGSKEGVSGRSLDPQALFIDLSRCDVAFKTWHPKAVTDRGDRLCGQSDVGGLWEWTSTPLAAFENFKAMDLYPGYTADFFDGKHNICLGGSWATAPRIAGRKSFVNWYQRNYPYTWCTARLVRDVA